MCISPSPTGRIFTKFGIGDPNNVANTNVSSYSTIDKMPTGATFVNKLANCLKTYRLFIGDVKISDCVCTLIYGHLWLYCLYFHTT